MAIRKVQQGFVAGELAPSMYGRFDDGKYAQGLALCRNFIVLPQGPVIARPGTSFVNTTKYPDKPARIIPFTFSIEQTMALEFGDKYIRFHTQGKTLLTTGKSRVALAEGDVPYEVETPYSADEVFDIRYVQSMDVMTLVHPAHPPRELRRYGATDWRLVDIVFGPPLTPPGKPTCSYSVVGSGITEEEKTRYELRYKITAIRDTDTGSEESDPSEEGSVKGNLYLNNAYVELTWTAVPGAARYRVYKSHKGVFGYIGETNELKFIDDNYEPDVGITPPIYDDPFLQAKGIVSVTVVDGGSGYARSFKDMMIAGNTYQGTEEDRTLEGITFNNMRQRDDTDLRFSGTYTGGQLKGFYASVRGNHKVNNFFFNSGGWSDGRIAYSDKYATLTGTIRMSINESHPSMDEVFDDEVSLVVDDATGYGAVLRPVLENGVIKAVNVIQGGRNYTDPKIRVIAEKGSGAKFTVEIGKGKDFPSAVCYFEQRRCFAGTNTRPQTVWMTRTGTESDMSFTLPVQDDNRVKFRIAAQEASGVLHLVPLQHLIVLTNSTEYRVSSGGSGPITPSDVDSKVQAQIGASTVQPVVVNSTLVYAAARGGHVRELGYNYQAGGYVTGDLSIRSAHLFEGLNIKDMTLAKSPDPIVWSCTSDGALAGLTYLPEQSIGGWHKHTTEGGVFESVAAIPEGSEDILYLVVRRTINGQPVRYIERMHERKFDSLEASWRVDCGGEYVGPETTTVSGLNWLEGETVSILANGCVLPKRVVKDGKVELTQPSTHVIVGLPIISDLQTLPLAVQLQDGSYGTGHMKNINQVWVRVVNSSGIFAGPDFENLTEVRQRTTEPYGTPPDLMNKETSVVLAPKWSDSGQLCIRQEDPLPLTVVSISYDLAQ